jgi:hypothetical protein
MTGKVKTNLNGTTVERFIHLVGIYLDSLNKPVFRPIEEDVKRVSLKLIEMRELQVQVKEGSHKAVVLRNAIRKSINADMSRLCEWINIMAHGDKKILMQCAFEPVKPRTAAPIPTEVSRLNVIRTEERGKAIVTWKGNGSKFYRTQMTLNPNEKESWKDVATVATNKCELENLPVGMFCYFRVQGVNSAGAGEYSNITMYMAS